MAQRDDRRTVSIRLFGEPAIVADGTTTTLSSRQGSLLAALVLVGSGGARTDVLAEYLWPGEMPPTATVALRGHVKKLRAILGPEADQLLVRRPNGGYRLDLDSIHVDVVEFDRGCVRAHQAARDGRPGDALDEAEAALALWTGEPFIGMEDVPVATAEQAVLADRRANCWTLIGEVGLSAGLEDRVVQLLEPAIRAAPSDERVAIPLVRALAALGRTPEAVRVADDAQQALRRDIGVFSEEIASLAERLRTTPSPSPAEPQPVRRPDPVDAPPLVGREEELAQLASHLTVEDGRPGLTLLRGPAGV
ncbi:MAG: BTAD domain-containing putative transcriptional regulator, partial [Actinomycetota bacterium]